MLGMLPVFVLALDPQGFLLEVQETAVDDKVVPQGCFGGSTLEGDRKISEGYRSAYRRDDGRDLTPLVGR
jgi:hypothetical protein